MPTEDRGEIGQVKPSGWQTVRYDDLIEGKYLYNRCHLIGYQLTAENANKQNLMDKVEKVCSEITRKNLAEAAEKGITPTENAYRSVENRIYK